MRHALLLCALVGGCGRPAPTEKDVRAAESYDAYRRPDLLVAALDLRPGQIVADVGAGSGYLTWRLAAAVAPSGRVVATDLDAAALERLAARGADTPALRPLVTTRQVTREAHGLEPGAYDLILLSEVDHLLDDRARDLGKLRAALRPGGRLAVSNRRTYRDAVLAAAPAAGLAPVREVSGLPAHFLVILEKAP